MKKLILSCFALFALTAWAQEIPAKEELNGTASQEVSALRLANDLIKYGHSQQLALPLVNAIQIIVDTPSQPSTATMTEGESAQKDGGVAFDLKALIDEAKMYADGDNNTLAIIAEIEKAAGDNHRGAVGGPGRQVDVVGAGRTVTYSMNYIAGQTAEVAVSGDGDTDLDLFIYDSNGNLIAKDNDYSDDCYVRWCPRWTGRFVIKVVNRGGVANRYVIMTN